MISSVPNIFKIPDLRRKILFTLAMVVVYRLGAHIPIPGINAQALGYLLGQMRGTVFGLYDIFVGGALSRAAILALVLAQVIEAAGWGEYFPWSVPALYAGITGPEYPHLGTISYLIVILASLIGMIGTFAWWELADQA